MAPHLPLGAPPDGPDARTARILVGMRVLFASSEVFPFSKTGGLGDVVGALPAALAALGHEVLVVSPWYRRLKALPAPLWIGDVDVPFDGGVEGAGVGVLERGAVRFAFVGHPDFGREAIYGYDDDVRRFARFTRALPAVAARLGFRPDLVHVHDWHTAALPLVLGHGWHLPDGWPGLPSVLTVHNVQHQGVAGLEETLHWLRLPLSLRASYLDHFGRANLLQGGLGFAWEVTTVSPTYAEEIQLPEFGYGLDGTFRHIAPKLHGILNGLDTEEWDPATDPALPVRYGAADLAGKAACKAALCAELGLPADRPLLGVVSRLAEQKGIDLLLSAAEEALARGWAIALLGSGDAGLEHHAADLDARTGAFRAVLGYDEELAHRIYAGADALAVPSRFEPCGLSQLIAMRYGTLPVARDTGGLHDTIRHGETGFLFADARPAALLGALEEARTRLEDGRAAAMRAAAMAQDFGWAGAARAYEDVYRRALAQRGPAAGEAAR